MHNFYVRNKAIKKSRDIPNKQLHRQLSTDINNNNLLLYIFY